MFFSSMAGGPLLLPALLLLPILYSVLIGCGFTRENIIEDDVYKIWASESSDFYQDRKYARDAGVKPGVSSLLAIASSRDGNNIMNADRLEEIRARMEDMEKVTVEHDGNTFTWQDICASNNIGLGTVYEFPCVRLTPMDLFQEANWYMTEKDRVSWYNEGIKKNVINPRVGRFGVMIQYCGGEDHCKTIIDNRTAANTPLKLFSDLTGMQMNNDCRICIENNYEATMTSVTNAGQGLFKVMYNELLRSLTKQQNDPLVDQDTTKMLNIANLLPKVGAIIAKIDRSAIEEWFMYYIARQLYGRLGATEYIGKYNDVNEKCGDCIPSLAERLAANGNDDLAIASEDLLNHADASFSSVNTAGLPYPVTALGGPQGGSGIDFKGTTLSATAYFDLLNYGQPGWNPKYGPTGADGSDGIANLDDVYWAAMVESDPVYKWFMAGETKMTAHCGNQIVPQQLLISQWCTKYSVPYGVDKEKTQQHFAKMWYDLLLVSPGFLGLTQGVDDPYTWTSGSGCSYDVKGSRSTYTNQTESSILLAASNQLYFIDEGASIGVLEKTLLMGGTKPPIDQVTASNPFEKVTSFQNIYPALVPEAMVKRVRNHNRPNGTINISEEDAEIVIENFKKSMIDAWSADWDDEKAGEIEFTGFFDSVGVPGTFEFVLRDISDDSAILTLISVGLIAVVSILFLASCNMVDSRIGITLVGVIIVLLSFLGALGCSILLGIKININIAWTLPFIMIGLGVDDMYIVLNAMKSRGGNSNEDFVAAMKEIVAPVCMTSMVNICMFAMIYFLTDIGAIYQTALVALIAVVFLLFSILFCYPAYCYLDMKRQDAKHCDIFVCIKGEGTEGSSTKEDSSLYIAYRRMFLTKNPCSTVLQAIVIVVTIAFFAIGVYGISQREVGVGLQDFFPKTNQANRWAAIRNEDLAAWPIGMSWGKVDYTKPDNQLKIMKQFEDVVDSSFVLQVDTKWLWIADFNLWTTRQCGENFDSPDKNECGADQTYVGDASDNGTVCEGTWVENTFGLKAQKIESVLSTETCDPFDYGICRPSTEMFEEDLNAINASSTDEKFYCPVFEGWSEDKLKFCVQRWRKFTGGRGGILVEEGTATPYSEDGVELPREFIKDDEIISPIPISSSPTMYANNLLTHEKTVDMIKETRAICDDAEIHCFMTGIPFDFWEQYITVENVLLRLSCGCVLIGFVVSTAFLFLVLNSPKANFGKMDKFIASLSGCLLIAFTIVLCLVPVIGLSLLVDVSLTAFSNMAFVLSVGFATEYSVHVVQRFLSAPSTIKSSAERVEYTMKFLTQPLTLSFLSSTAGVACLSFTDFAFSERFFFRPLMIVMVITYFIGTFFLPILLTKLDFEFLKVGHVSEEAEDNDKVMESFHDDAK